MQVRVSCSNFQRCVRATTTAIPGFSQSGIPACAADQLRTAVPDAGHLVHMPTHIDVLCGLYKNVCDWNGVAVAADRKYLDRRGAKNFSLYRCHNYHFRLYGAMFLGEYETAIRAAQEMIANLPEELLRVESPPMADWLEGFLPMKQHVLVRFGKWVEIIQQPLPADRVVYSTTTAMIHYAKAVAHAVLGNIGEAEREADTLWRRRFGCSTVPLCVQQHLPGHPGDRRGDDEGRDSVPQG